MDHISTPQSDKHACQTQNQHRARGIPPQPTYLYPSKVRRGFCGSHKNSTARQYSCLAHIYGLLLRVEKDLYPVSQGEGPASLRVICGSSPYPKGCVAREPAQITDGTGDPILPANPCVCREAAGEARLQTPSTLHEGEIERVHI